eukprot:9372485-Pyramimonas_sp.AAC.1
MPSTFQGAVRLHVIDQHGYITYLPNVDATAALPMHRRVSYVVEPPPIPPVLPFPIPFAAAWPSASLALAVRCPAPGFLARSPR